MGCLLFLDPTGSIKPQSQMQVFRAWTEQTGYGLFGGLSPIVHRYFGAFVTNPAVVLLWPVAVRIEAVVSAQTWSRIFTSRLAVLGPRAKPHGHRWPPWQLTYRKWEVGCAPWKYNVAESKAQIFVRIASPCVLSLPTSVAIHGPTRQECNHHLSRGKSEVATKAKPPRCAMM